MVEGIGQRTVGRLMQLFEEYGTKPLDSPDSDGNPNASLVTHLTYNSMIIHIILIAFRVLRVNQTPQSEV